MKSRWFLRVARPYVRWKLRRSFEDVRIAGEQELLRALARGPLVLAMNHVTFWDALLLVYLDERWGGGGLALMDRMNLGKLPFFARAGAIPIARHDKRLAWSDLKAAAKTLDTPGRYVVIFPQGEEHPAKAPLQYASGVRVLAAFAGDSVAVVPVALRYDFGKTPRPFVHVSIGTSMPSSPSLASELARATERMLDAIDEEMRLLNGATTSLKETAFESSFRRSYRALPGGTGALARLLGGPSGV